MYFNFLKFTIFSLCFIIDEIIFWKRNNIFISVYDKWRNFVINFMNCIYSTKGANEVIRFSAFTVFFLRLPFLLLVSIDQLFDHLGNENRRGLFCCVNIIMLMTICFWYWFKKTMAVVGGLLPWGQFPLLIAYSWFF